MPPSPPRGKVPSSSALVNKEWILSAISSPIPYLSLTASPHNPQPLAHIAQAGDTLPGAVGEAPSQSCHPLRWPCKVCLPVNTATQSC